MTMDGCCHKCMCYSLLIINVIVALCGLGLTATGLLIKFGVNDWIPIDDIANLLNSQLLRSATYIIIAAGGFVFIVAICGCLGALFKNKYRYLLVLYFLLLFIVFTAQIAAGIVAAIYTREITNYLSTEALAFLRNDYGSKGNTIDELGTASWDLVQRDLMCCGVSNKWDYAGNPYLVSMGRAYPESCCGTPGTGCSDVRANGCRDAIEKLISDYGTIIGATAIGVALFEFCCLLLAICLCRNVGEEDYW